MELTACKLFRVRHPRIVLYEEGTLTTKKLAMVVMVVGAFLAKTDRVMAFIGWRMSLVKTLRGIRARRSLSELIPILMKAS